MCCTFFGTDIHMPASFCALLLIFAILLLPVTISLTGRAASPAN